MGRRWAPLAASHASQADAVADAPERDQRGYVGRLAQTTAGPDAQERARPDRLTRGLEAGRGGLAFPSASLIFIRRLLPKVKQTYPLELTNTPNRSHRSAWGTNGGSFMRL